MNVFFALCLVFKNLIVYFSSALFGFIFYFCQGIEVGILGIGGKLFFFLGIFVHVVEDEVSGVHPLFFFLFIYLHIFIIIYIAM